MPFLNTEYFLFMIKETKESYPSPISSNICVSTYSYRVSNKPVLHPEFKRSVKELPKTYNLDFKKRFYKFINTYGTHYITKVILVYNLLHMWITKAQNASTTQYTASQIINQKCACVTFLFCR